MIDDARVVLEWLGYERSDVCGRVIWEKVGTTGAPYHCAWEGEFEYYLDANWIMGTLVPVLEERLKLRYGAFWPLHGTEIEVSISTPEAMYRETGPTFEAAFLAAAAAAIRGTSGDR